MSDDVKQQVITELKEAPLGKFSIQLESTDVAACAQLMVFARYISGEDLKENFLYCHTIDSTTRDEDIFNKVLNFFEREELSWNNVCECTTDGAPSMLGRRSRFRGQVVEKNSKTKHLHCMLHRYALACKTLPPELRLVLDDAAVHMINTIKSSSLKTRLFSQLSQELGSDREALLYHTKVRWLSRGNVIRRVESLNEELSEFFRRDNKTRSVEFIQKLSDSRWLQRLAYLSDILSRLNILNLSLQERFHTVIDFMDKLESFIMKVTLSENKVKDGNLSMFENLDETLNKNKITENLYVTQLVQAHLVSLRMELQSYFPKLNEVESKSIRNPFIVNVQSLPDRIQEEFLELFLVNDSVAKNAFETLTLTKFWTKMSVTYPVVSDIVLNSLLIFPSTYLCEQEFSTLLNIKSKLRSRLNVEHDLRLCLSNTTPRIEKLICKKQAQPLH